MTGRETGLGGRSICVWKDEEWIITKEKRRKKEILGREPQRHRDVSADGSGRTR